MIEPAWLHLCADGAGTRVCAVGACTCAAGWPVTARPAEIDAFVRELARSLRAGRLLAWDARALDALLSRPEVVETTTLAREALRDVRAAALLVYPTLRDWSLTGVARALHLATDAEAHAAVTDPEVGTELVRRVAGAVQAGLSALSAGALALVRELVAADSEFDWLAWDELALPALEAAAMEVLIAARPQAPSPRERKRITLDGPLGEVAAARLDADGPVAAEMRAQAESGAARNGRSAPSYEHRPGQLTMARAVGEALTDGGVLMVEAGTGVGKSLAYLVPAILWARAHAEAVVVSTNTKNLQEQLIEKDLPLLARSLGVEFRSALLKGRSNYVCLRRFVTAIRDARASMRPEDRRAAAFLVSWLAADESGDLDGIPAEAERAFGGLRHLVSRVRSERALCLGPGCQYAKHCPMRVARAVARNADIIVSNHALTLADTQFDVLPKSGRLIFDEAHNLEAVATDQLGYEVSSFTLADLRRALGGDSRRRGILDSLTNYLAGSHPSQAEAITEPRRRLLAAVEALEGAGEQLGDAVVDLCVALDPEAVAGRARLRLGADVYADPHWRSVGQAIEHLRDVLTIAAGALREMGEALAEGAERGSPEADLAMEAVGARAAVEELIHALGTITHDEPDAGYVSWAETTRRGGSDLWRMRAAPIDVGPALRRAVYDTRSAVVMTSATLTVDGEFAFMRRLLGLDGDAPPVREQVVASPFAYPEQLLLCIPEDIPTRGEEGRGEALIDALLDIARVARGGLLVLFTARAQMERVFAATRARFADEGLTPLCQYVSGPRTWLLEQLRERDTTVLFGLKSFWEGVDVPGPALRCVVIVKLPFAVPTDPIVQARCELAAARGLDGGGDYYIPEAILGFKQGIGRLVRSTTDTGVVFVLDNRLLTRGYGRRFLGSIPQGRLEVGSFEECLLEAERWLRWA
jgi:Rad3-related DNA helicase